MAVAMMVRSPMKLHLPLLLYTTILLVLFVLLILDLDYKIRFVGPSDTNSFRTATDGVLRDSPMVPTSSEFTKSESAMSSWPHFVSTCDNFTSFDSGGGFTVIVLGTNCTLGHGAARFTTQNIIAASTVRLDSIVWTCYKLLFPSQQPSICQDHISTDFLNRYMLPDITVNIGDLAQEGSTEEKELTTFLDMVSRSYPLHRMVCLEGFVWPNQTLGVYHTTIYGCASPNSFRSEFIGISNPKVRDMLRTRVWLSADTFEILGMRFGIRQNSFNYYTVEDTGKDGALVVRGRVSTNFSCFGPLYSIMVIMDVMVLLIYLRAGYESVKWVLGPQYRKIIAKQSAKQSCRTSKPTLQSFQITSGGSSTNLSSIYPTTGGCTVRKVSRARSTSSMQAAEFLRQVSQLNPAESYLEGVVRCSIYNHWLVVVLIIGSQMLSWLLVLPNTIIWSWSLLESSKIRGAVSSVRSIVLVIMSFDLCWAGVVKINEELAYFVSSRTFVSPLEIMLISVGVTMWKSFEITHILDTKWQGEHQRVYDYLGFPGYIAHGSVFDGALDFQHGTPYSVFLIVYNPLFEVIGFSTLFTVLYLVVKGVAFYLYVLRRGRQTTPYDAESNGLHGLEHGEYHRLPIELLLDFPIRARCLMRNNLSMEILINEQRLICPSCYLDSGILPRDRTLRPTSGTLENA